MLDNTNLPEGFQQLPTKILTPVRYNSRDLQYINNPQPQLHLTTRRAGNGRF